MKQPEITITRVKKYNAAWNQVICLDGVPVAIAKSNNRASEIVAYLMGNRSSDVNDNGLRHYLDRAMEAEK